jgi:hypothetical protein
MFLDDAICNNCILQIEPERPVVLHKIDKEIEVQVKQFGGKFKAAKLNRKHL